MTLQHFLLRSQPIQTISPVSGSSMARRCLEVIGILTSQYKLSHICSVTTYYMCTEWSIGSFCARCAPAWSVNACRLNEDGCHLEWDTACAVLMLTIFHHIVLVSKRRCVTSYVYGTLEIWACLMIFTHLVHVWQNSKVTNLLGSFKTEITSFKICWQNSWSKLKFI